MDKSLLGEILIKRQRINKEQLAQALDVQAKGKSYLGEILVQLGFIDEMDIVIALVVQCSLPYIAINKYTIDQEILKRIPKETAQRDKLVPLDCVGDILSVVMTNPLSEEKKNELEALTKCRIATFISTRSEIDAALVRMY